MYIYFLGALVKTIVQCFSARSAKAYTRLESISYFIPRPPILWADGGIMSSTCPSACACLCACPVKVSILRSVCHRLLVMLFRVNKMRFTTSFEMLWCCTGIWRESTPVSCPIRPASACYCLPSSSSVSSGKWEILSYYGSKSDGSRIYIGWQWRNFVPYLCQLVFAAVL